MAHTISNFRLYLRDSDWLNFIHFSGYKYMIRLFSIFLKREDQALISLSTILKFSAQVKYEVSPCVSTEEFCSKAFFCILKDFKYFIQ